MSVILANLHYIAFALAALAVALVISAVLGRDCPDFEVRGRRGGNRVRFFQGGLGRTLLPLLQQATAYAVMLRLPKQRAQLELWLRQADHPAGLVPSEVLGLSLLGAVVFGGLTGLEIAWPMALPLAVLGLVLPYTRIRELADQRTQEVSRSLPTMADLLVLSMESGMDFIGAVRLLVSKSTATSGRLAIRDEFLVFLQQLQLGRTRKSALQQFAERVPTEPVRAFTTAVIQAEEKGMPLRDVLRIQAEILRHRRIQQSEAYIETANLKMLGPVMLVLMALLAVIIVPVVLNMGDQINGGGMGQ